MYQTGLLLLTQPLPVVGRQAAQVLKHVTGRVRNTLYVQLLPKIGVQQDIDKFLPCTPLTLNLVTNYYSEFSKTCNLESNKQCDMRFLLSNISNRDHAVGATLPRLSPLRELIEVVYIDQTDQDLVYWKQYVLQRFLSGRGQEEVEVTFSSLPEFGLSDETAKASEEDQLQKCYTSVCMGGTFDRIHTGHKILLSEACLLAEDVLTVGVTDQSMLQKKVLNELILPTDVRINGVLDLLQDIAPQLDHRVVPISDPYGPSINDPHIEAIVVSEETLKGGHMVNDERQKRGMKTLDIHTISLVEDACHSQYEENKISSSSGRKRMLGTLLKPPTSSDLNVPASTYIIGLTGGIGSGKTSVCGRLAGLGAHIIDCDKLGHKAYVKGTAAFHKVVDTFGEEVIGEDGEINRKVLGPKVFSSKEELEKLNQIVWPAIGELAKEEIKQITSEKGDKCVIVLDAAVLLEAGWDHMTHEIWVTFVPKEEAVKRIIERNKLSEEQATQRISSQVSNTERVRRAHVTLCTMWQYEYTQQQVEKAWSLLQTRIS